MPQDATRTSWTVYYGNGRPCDLVFSADAVARKRARGDVVRVVRRVRRWTGSWGDPEDPRRFTTLSEDEE